MLKKAASCVVAENTPQTLKKLMNCEKPLLQLERSQKSTPELLLSHQKH